MKKIILFVLLLGVTVVGIAQTPDTLQISNESTSSIETTINPYAFKYKQIIIPSVLIGAGVASLESDWIKDQNQTIRDAINENFDGSNSIENYAMCVPIVSVYVLNLCGVKGKHDFRNGTLLIGTSLAFMSVSVYPIKYSLNIMRPDSSNRNSFPSGHTALAFAGANFLWHEYKDVSPWIGVAGFVVASGVGFFRMYNNRHWLTDVIAGAGIGILSTEAAYWMMPTMQRVFTKISGKSQLSVAPYISLNNKGICLNITF